MWIWQFCEFFCYVQGDIYLQFSTIYLWFSNLLNSTYENICQTLTRHLIFFAWLAYFRVLIYSVELFWLTFLCCSTETTHFSYVCAYSFGLLNLSTGFKWKLQPTYTANCNTKSPAIHIFVLPCHLEALLYKQKHFSNTNLLLKIVFLGGYFLCISKKKKKSALLLFCLK